LVFLIHTKSKAVKRYSIIPDQVLTHTYLGIVSTVFQLWSRF